MFSKKFLSRLKKFDEWYQSKIAALAADQEKKMAALKEQYRAGRENLTRNTHQQDHR